jgi:predicted ATPase
LLLRRNPNAPDRAKASYRRAIERAHSQEARSWELRAATSLARLWRDQGKPAEARELLAPIFGWFTEGFNTADLKEAKGLLNELSETRRAPHGQECLLRVQKLRFHCGPANGRKR